jgi:hypothetical protein
VGALKHLWRLADTPHVSWRPGFGRLARVSGRLLRFVALVGLVMPLALAAYAAISSINPSSGAAEPGDTVSATVSFDQGGLVNVCPVGLSDDPSNITVAFPGCSPPLTGAWETEMQVAVGPSTAPGDYTITLTNFDLTNLALTYEWPLTVNAPPTTTTSSTTTTTTSPTTTTTSTSTTTTSTTATTTTTSGSSPTTTSASSPTTTSAASPTTTSAASPTTTDHIGPTTTTSDGLALVVPAGGPSDPGPGADRGTEEAGASARSEVETPEIVADRTASPFSEVALSSGLIEKISGAAPSFVANAVASPFVVAEVLLRALGRTVTGLLVPILLTLLFGLLLFWRLRPAEEELEADMPADGPLDLPGGAT